jgi:uncharacterized surface protein with fasciclin (FAS1) repeats
MVGRQPARDFSAAMHKGKATLTTVQGEPLTVSKGPGKTWMLTDANGGTAAITMADVNQSNGVIHAIDSVLMP